MVKLRPSEGFAVEPRTFLVIQAAPIDYSRPVVECTCASVNQAAGLQGGRRRSEGGERLGWREWDLELEGVGDWESSQPVLQLPLGQGVVTQPVSCKTEQGSDPQPQRLIEKLHQKNQLH